MNFADVFYQSDDGLRLYARDYPGPDATAPVLLCLPGLTRNSKDFAPFAEEFQSAYRVICPDQRGRGRSGWASDTASYNPERYARDMMILLDLLGVKKVALVGTSLGGLMAMLLMAMDAGRVCGVVLNDVGPEVDPAGLARIASYVGKAPPVRDWDGAAAQTAHTNGLAFPEYGSSDWQAMARDLYIQEGAVPVLNYDPAIGAGVTTGGVIANLWPLFDAIPPKPMLVIRGETSDILSVATVNEMARRMPNMTALTIANRGHAPTLSESAARTALRSFLANVEGLR